MKFSNLLIVLALFLMTACGGEESVSPEATLVGNWELQEFTVKMETNTIISNESYMSIVDVEGENLSYDLTFSEASFNTEGSYGYKVDMEIDGDKTSQNLSVSDVKGDGTYTVNGDEFTSDGAFFELDFQGMNFDIAQGEATATIEKLTDKELIFSQNTIENMEQEVAGSSFSVEAKLIGRSVWKRK